ncbi:MAG: helix-turn-helix domain-containing protein [Streptosporangiaceae bacterium]
MTSERGDEATAAAGSAADPRGSAAPPGTRDEHGRLNLTNPKAIRALAHPIRWALLEALGQAGTLTATQASEMLGESPANCAFHLRTLAKYGFIEEAGGGRGRERPWRQVFHGMSWQTSNDDPQTTLAAQALDQVWLDRSLARARRSMTSRTSWPESLGDAMGGFTSRNYLTPKEAKELYAELQKTFERLLGSGSRFAERKDPGLRPPDALPMEFVMLGYPVLDLPPIPEGDDTDDDFPHDEPEPAG